VTDLAAAPRPVMASFAARPPGATAAPAAAAPARLVRAFFATRLYDLTLAGKAPADLARPLAVRWPGDAARGAALVGGEFRFAGEAMRGRSPFAGAGAASERFLAEAHGFEFLADLSAHGGAAARDAARTQVRAWLEANARWSPLAWRADVVGTRLAAWIAYWDELVPPAPAEDALRRAMLSSLVRQTRHLARVAATELPGAARLRAVKGLVFAALALGHGARKVEAALALLERELPLQLKPDGGHVERSPAVQLAALQDLVDIRTALRAAQVPLPAGLQSAIDRMAPMLRFFRHGDGRLAQFNGTAEGFGPILDLVLSRAEAKGKPPASAPHSGFQRLQAGKTLVIVDTGAPPPRGLDDKAHAGTLAFEMSHGRERLIVNCGSYAGPAAEWARAARATAAHSTLVVADTNSSELRADGSFGRRPERIHCERQEEDGSQWVSASHDGYRQRFGLIHARELFLSADGDDLRGEDRIEGRPGSGFTIRFHLHPDVDVSIIQDGDAVLLRLASGVGWRLRAQGAQLGLAESVYLGAGETRKTQQVVLSGHVGSQGAVVRWAIRRETRKPAEPG
jgi:uncharacterized heparinase superfamily protein